MCELTRDQRYNHSEKGRARNRRHDAKRSTRPEHNAERIFVGATYVGTENQFPAPREAVEQFASELIARHKEAHGTHE